MKLAEGTKLQRLAARMLDLTLVVAIMALGQKLSGERQDWLIFAVILYEWIILLSGGQSLGRYLIGLRLSAPGPYSGVRLLLREVIFWFLLPLVLLSFLWKRPLHDRICRVQVLT